MKTLTLLAVTSLFALGCDRASDATSTADRTGSAEVSAAPEIDGDRGQVSTAPPSSPTVPTPTAVEPDPVAPAPEPEPVKPVEAAKPAKPATPVKPEPEPEAEPEPDIETEEDFEDEAIRSITEDNLEEELARLEKELG